MIVLSSKFSLARTFDGFPGTLTSWCALVEKSGYFLGRWHAPANTSVMFSGGIGKLLCPAHKYGAFSGTLTSLYVPALTSNAYIKIVTLLLLCSALQSLREPDFQKAQSLEGR